MNTATSELIRISYTENGELMLEGTEMMGLGSGTPSWQKWSNLAIPPLVCGLMAANWALRHDWLGVGVALAVMPLITWTVWRVYFPTKRSQLKRYRKLYVQTIGREETSITCDFGKGGYSMTTGQGNTSQQTWASLVRVVEKPQGLLLYTNPKVAQWIPKRFFSPDAYARVIELVRANVTNFQGVNARK